MSKCKQCDAEVTWINVEGRWSCHNAGTDVDHWDSCSQRRTARIVKGGTAFTEKRREGVVEGYKTSRRKSGELLMKITARTILSRTKRSGQCGECVPPWERCAGCPDAFALALP